MNIVIFVIVILPILPLLYIFLPLCRIMAAWRALQPLLIVLVFVTFPTEVVDGATTIWLNVGGALTDTVEGEKELTVDSTGGIVCEMGKAGLVKNATLLIVEGRMDWLPGRCHYVVVCS